MTMTTMMTMMTMVTMMTKMMMMTMMTMMKPQGPRSITALAISHLIQFPGPFKSNKAVKILTPYNIGKRAQATSCVYATLLKYWGFVL